MGGQVEQLPETAGDSDQRHVQVEAEPALLQGDRYALVISLEGC